MWVAPDGNRWIFLDNRDSLEVYPEFADAVPPPAAPLDLVVAPRVIDLHRDGDALVGELRRRYMRRGDSCDAHAAVRVTACKRDELELVIADVAAPLGFAPCRWPLPLPPHVERWRRD
jgi:hypothetical protein